MSRVVAAAAAAVSAGPALAGNSPPVVRARRVIGRLAAAAGIPSRDVAWAAGVSGRSARRLVHAATDEAGERAARVRLALEDAVRAVRDAAPPRPG